LFTVKISEMKKHLSKFLDQVMGGEQVTITRHGGPVAKLVCVTERDSMNPAQVIERIRELSKGATLGGLSIRELIDEGRNY